MPEQSESVVVVCPPPARQLLPLTAVLAVGFGFVEVTRDGEGVWHGDDEHVWLRRFERRAAAEEGQHIWKVRFVGPMLEALYERRGPGEWELTETGMGFA